MSNLVRFGKCPFIPDGICIFCVANPSQRPNKGYCVSCEEKNIQGFPSSFFPKCTDCNKWHKEFLLKPKQIFHVVKDIAPPEL